MWKSFLMGGAVLSLSACAACPEIETYTREPYTSERTAGSGMAVYKGICPSTPMAKQEKTMNMPPSQKAEKIFQKEQQKK